MLEGGRGGCGKGLPALRPLLGVWTLSHYRQFDLLTTQCQCPDRRLAGLLHLDCGKTHDGGVYYCKPDTRSALSDACCFCKVRFVHFKTVCHKHVYEKHIWRQR